VVSFKTLIVEFPSNRVPGMSSLLKQRPVGNRVTRYGNTGSFQAGWHDGYEVLFLDSGTSALSFAIRLAIDTRKPAGPPEVLIPAYGCPDLIAAVVSQGAIPVLIDLIPNRPWMDLAQIKAIISGNTVGIVAVNFLGIPERLPQLSEIANHHSIYLIDDSAQCFPPVLKPEPFADCIVLSFGRGKPVNLMGGGALLIRQNSEPEASPFLAEYKTVTAPGPFVWAMKRTLMNFLMARLPYSLLARLPFLKLGETRYKPLQAIQRMESMAGPLHSGIQGLLTRPARHLEYDRQLEKWAETAGCSLLASACKSENGVFEARYSYPLLRYPVLLHSKHERDRLLNVFEQAGLGVNAFYGRALPEVAGVADTVPKFRAATVLKAQSFADRLLVLPTHDSVSSEQVVKISKILEGEI
jgi:dTDP-4-amino-4,6-dideoxygalactose transaminase